ncbi:hypothetical protein EXN66_Car003689 [Channa argus]|uniref:Uncharacterized protein n=1 Tax=Channa argus TaxID=215402 RepID=A0A6G1PCP7_CHAAH|nr:hypothetical protein EXN66_Car003689 [Channa argus]
MLCVSHFGSVVTILDKRVVLWSQNGGGIYLPVCRVLVHRQAVNGEVRGKKRRVCVCVSDTTVSDAMPGKTIQYLNLMLACFIVDSP